MSEMCAACQNLVGKGKSGSKHAKLEATGERPFSSMMGAADESYYKCTDCGHEWTYESGSCGFGWIE